jgi:hypothetical protein
VPDGHTLALGIPMNPAGEPVEKPGDGRKRLVLFITPTLIDPAGNPVHASPE